MPISTASLPLRYPATFGDESAPRFGSSSPAGVSIADKAGAFLRIVALSAVAGLGFAIAALIAGVAIDLLVGRAIAEVVGSMGVGF